MRKVKRGKYKGMNIVEKRRVNGTKVGVCVKGYVIQSKNEKKVPLPSKVGLKKWEAREYKGGEKSARKWKKYHKKRGKKVKQVGRHLIFKKPKKNRKKARGRKNKRK